MIPAEVVRAAAKEFGVTYDELVGPSRFQRIVAIRSVVAGRLRSQGLTYPEVGRALRRHHTTVMNLLGLFDKPRKSPRRAPCTDPGHLCKDSVAA